MAEVRSKVQLEIISTETIKPSSPTPAHLKTYKFSVIDQLVSPLYVPMILFYPNVHNPKSSDEQITIRRQLKYSLSNTLAQYYPFAGRVVDNSATIDCNDAGVDYVEAQLHHCQLSHVVEAENESETLKLLFPRGFLWRDSCKDASLLGIQVTLFDCGGMAVVACISHKIADGCSISSFLSDWAAMSRHQHLATPPKFVSALVDALPLLNSSASEMEIEQKKCATRRFVFDASKIAKLRAASAAATPVEAVTAFLYKCGTDVAAAAESKKEICVLLQMVGMRTRVVPPFSTNFIGNFSWFFSISTKISIDIDCEDEICLDELVSALRSEKKKLLGDYNSNNYKGHSGLKVNDWLKSVAESTEEVKVLFDNIEAYRCSSFTGKSFSFYEADFGWGKPVLVRMADGVVTNTFILFDSADGRGIDAWVTLDERDMPLFQRRHDHHLSAM